MKKHKSSQNKHTFWYASDKAKRPFNEDVIFVKDNLFAIADGHGQAKGEDLNAGSIASQETLSCLTKAFFESKSTYEWNLDEFRTFFLNQSTILKKRLYEICHQHEPPLYSGTTLEFVLIGRDNILFAHVGDSRIYAILKDQGFRQITKDETVAVQLVEAGQIDERAAKVWSRNFVLTNSISFDSVNIRSIGELSRSDIEFLLIATDGLTDKLFDQEIHDCIVENSYSPQAIVSSLISKAKTPSYDFFKLYIEFTDEANHLIWVNQAHDMRLIDDLTWENIASAAAINIYKLAKKSTIQSLNMLIPSVQFLYGAFGESNLVTYVLSRSIQDTAMNQIIEPIFLDDSIKENIGDLKVKFDDLLNRSNMKIGQLIIEATEQQARLCSFLYESFVTHFGGNDNISLIAINVNKVE